MFSGQRIRKLAIKNIHYIKMSEDSAGPSSMSVCAVEHDKVCSLCKCVRRIFAQC